MKITIHYCGRWNYLPRASSLAAEIEKTCGEKPELIRGDDGIFDVHRDGELLFSKHAEGRFPTDDEILSLL